MDQPINDIGAAHDFMDDGIANLTRSMEIMDSLLDLATPMGCRYLRDQIANMGSAIEDLTDRRASFEEECFDPELGDQGSVARSLKSQLKKAHKALYESPHKWTGYFGE